MSLAEQHVLERKSQPVRGARRVAPHLRAEMKARGVTAKELAMQIATWARQDPANRQAIDFRTIQNAADGTACAFETYLTLGGFLGWDFIEIVQTPVVGADPQTARERELERHLAQAAALHARVERDRAIRTATAPALAFMAGAAVAESTRARGEGRAFDPKAPQGLNPDGARP